MRGGFAGPGVRPGTERWPRVARGPPSQAGAPPQSSCHKIGILYNPDDPG